MLRASLRLAVEGAGALALAVALRLSPDVLDRPISRAVNSLAEHSPGFDFAIRTLDEFDLFQGDLMLAIAAAALVKAGDATTRTRLLIAGGAAALAAALSRLLQLVLPHSPRPMFDPAIHWRAPYDSDVAALHDWSSFPSDHASLLFGVAFAVAATNRGLGALALAAACVLGLERIYEGEHYFSDIVGGAVLAVVTVKAALLVARRFERPLDALVERRAGLVAAASFIFFCQASALFDDLRTLAATLVKHH